MTCPAPEAAEQAEAERFAEANFRWNFTVNILDVAFFLLAFGLTFEMPVVLVLLAKVGVVDDRFLRKNRRYAILVEAVLAAVLTPSQDAFSMLALFLPLVVLYEVSIVLAKIVKPKGVGATDGEQVKGPSDDDVSQATA
jgi:Sec-independent protein secretion pathway component TatC